MARKGTGHRAIAAIVAGASIGALALLSACGEAPAVAPSALDIEAERRLDEAAALHERVERIGGARELPALASREPGVFAGTNLLCGRLALPKGRYDRVIIAHGEAIHDGPGEGEWFDHVWQRTGCD